MHRYTIGKPIQVLLVDDDPADVRLTIEAMKETKLRTHIDTVGDGVEALAFLRQQGKYANAQHPDLILLDLNMPRKDGREVLAEIKADPDLRHIPVVVLTTSDDERDVIHSYDIGANSYVTKPVDLLQFLSVVKGIQNFWFTIVQLPPE
jgi:CheY-like chemotaxis protein